MRSVKAICDAGSWAATFAPLAGFWMTASRSHKRRGVMITRAKWVAALGTLALAGGSSGVALAGPVLEHPGLGANILKLSVRPEYQVQKGKAEESVEVIADGHSSTAAQLEVFRSGVTCDRSAGQEKLHGGHLIMDPLVGGRFSDGRRLAAPVGKHYACAYLSKPGAPNDTLARAEVSWRVVKK